MESERTPVVPANRLLEVAGVLSDGAARLHEQLSHVPDAERQALLETVVAQVGDIVSAWSDLVRAVVSVNGSVAPPVPAVVPSAPSEEAGPVERPIEVPDDAPPPPDPWSAAPEPTPPRPGNGATAASGPIVAVAVDGGTTDRGDGGWGAEAGTTARDELTGVLNRAAGFAAMAREIERCRQDGWRFVLGYLNVDGLRRVNDNAGPRAGDELLRKVVAALRATLRSYDVILRLAGDEFLFSLPGADMTTAERRVREFGAILGEEAPGASVSVGFAELRDGDTLDELVARADEALVQSRRRRGRPRLR